MKKIAYVGIDYHMNSLSLAVMLEGEKKIHQTIRLANKDKVVRKLFKKLSDKFEVQGCYEGEHYLILNDIRRFSRLKSDTFCRFLMG